MQRRIAVLLVAVLVAAALPGAASTFLARTSEELVADSSAVVAGHVVSVESFWNDDHSLILTEIVFEVERSVVGHAPRYVTVQTAGGTVDGYTVVAHGFPVFREGERALLFVTPSGTAERFRVTGYQQGHYRVVRNRQGEDIAVPTVDSGAYLAGPSGRLIPAPRAQRLSDLEQQLRDVARHLERFVPTQ
jgi:hypothetical protein